MRGFPYKKWRENYYVLYPISLYMIPAPICEKTCDDLGIEYIHELYQGPISDGTGGRGGNENASVFRGKDTTGLARAPPLLHSTHL